MSSPRPHELASGAKIDLALGNRGEFLVGRLSFSVCSRTFAMSLRPRHLAQAMSEP
jgi:hypothetical protein